MASKSKKRRRVLGASCILAALIIAGSSFAWFTSKDEVTNRLTASADYNVSIIENFAPPKQWVPGQTVTKEEAVVNTGNVDAFVHQTISGVMDISVEVASTEAPTGLDAAGYIKLKPAEAGSLEAGSYLAGAFDTTGAPLDGVELGNKVISVIPDTAGSEKLTDFNPKATGLYIFRRAITVTPGDTSPAVDQKYEYVGYYYVAKDGDPVGGQGTYYKLHNLYDSTLVLKENTDGDLASAPTVTYAKETKKTLNKVPMKYEAEAAAVGTEGQPGYVPAHGDRLVITYDKNASADTTDYNQLTFEKYRDYLDQAQGKTTWDTLKSTTENVQDAVDLVNKTGLIDNDEFLKPNTEYNKNPDVTDYTNFSSARLATRKAETAANVEAASPKTNGVVDWETVYNNAVADRKIVNRGIKAAEELVAKRTTVEGLIGTTTDSTKPGLYQNPNYTFHYSATTATVVPATLITLMTPTDTIGGDTTDVTGFDNGSGTATTTATPLDNMTADTMDNEEFADYDSEGVKWAVVTPTYASNAANNSALKTAFDNYVIALKKKALLDKKIKICEDAAALASGSTTSVARITLAGGGSVEVGEYKAILEAKRTALVNGDLATYEAEYNKQKKIVNDAITEMNNLQDEINLANEVDNNKEIPDGLFGGTNPTATYGGDKDATHDNNDTYPTEATGGRRSVVNGTNGTTDTITEQILKKYLENVYGVALKDQESDTTKKNNYYQADATKSTDGKARYDQPTYSPEVTKDAIDKSLDYDKSNGKIKWKDTLQAPLTSANTDSVEASPYHDDKTVEFMKKFRDGKVADAKAAYDAAVRAENGQGAVAEDGIVKIYVNLANLGDGETKEKWQYVADAATEEGKDFNFYYTSILPSGQTSSLLIESVEFDKDVKQHAFRDIQLDLNVTAESAQVVYNGDVIEATAANATITGAKTTADSYTTVDGPVKWVARTDTTPTTEGITDKDPNPKADVNVTNP